MTRKTLAMIAVFALGLTMGSMGVVRADLIVNGSFEDTSNVTPPNYPNSDPGLPGSGGIGQLGYNTVATGWSSPDTDYTASTGYNFVFAPATASSTGVVGYNGGIACRGPGNGFNNGLTASPDGGQFVGADGDTRYNGVIEQTVHGLTTGHSYELTFYWALAQQAGAGGTPTAQWQVSFGGQTQSTTMVQLPSPGGFVPWMTATMTFTADNSSDVLSFLATEGGPYGGPPFLLLDGVKLNAVPEPATLSLVAVGLFGVGAARRLKARNKATSA